MSTQVRLDSSKIFAPGPKDRCARDLDRMGCRLAPQSCSSDPNNSLQHAGYNDRPPRLDMLQHYDSGEVEALPPYTVANVTQEGPFQPLSTTETLYSPAKSSETVYEDDQYTPVNSYTLAGPPYPMADFSQAAPFRPLSTTETLYSPAKSSETVYEYGEYTPASPSETVYKDELYSPINPCTLAESPYHVANFSQEGPFGSLPAIETVYKYGNYTPASSSGAVYKDELYSPINPCTLAESPYPEANFTQGAPFRPLRITETVFKCDVYSPINAESPCFPLSRPQFRTTPPYAAWSPSTSSDGTLVGSSPDPKLRRTHGSLSRSIWNRARDLVKSVKLLRKATLPAETIQEDVRPTKRNFPGGQAMSSSPRMTCLHCAIICDDCRAHLDMVERQDPALWVCLRNRAIFRAQQLELAQQASRLRAIEEDMLRKYNTEVLTKMYAGIRIR